MDLMIHADNIIIDYVAYVRNQGRYYSKTRQGINKRLNTEKNRVLNFFDGRVKFPVIYDGKSLDREQLIATINKEFTDAEIYKRITSVKFEKVE